MALALFEYSILLFWLRQNYDDQNQENSKISENEANDEKKMQILKRIKMMRLADRISIFLFPLSFIIFVIVYAAVIVE